MVTVRIHDVPEDVVRELVRQAEAAGRTLNQYMLDNLRIGARLDALRNHREPDEEPRALTNAEVLARAHARPGKRPPPGWGTQEIRRMRDAAAGDR